MFASSKTTTIVSPHFDDAALSVGGAIQRMQGAITLVTACGGAPDTARAPSRWDAACGFESAHSAVAVRSGEDLRACQILGAVPQQLADLDSPYDEPDRSSLPHLRRFCANCCPPGSRVLIPAALGGNPDHLLVRNECLAALSVLSELEIWLYADMPYSARVIPEWGNDDMILTLGAQYLEEETGPIPFEISAPNIVSLSAAEWRKKHEAVLSYASQLALLGGFTQGFLSYPGPLQTELLWLLRHDRPMGHAPHSQALA